MDMEQLLRMRQAPPRKAMAPPQPGAAPPAGKLVRHELYVRSNDANSDTAYAMYKRVPTFRDVIDVFNITSTGTRPSWLQGTPCLLFRHSDGQQTRAHYGTNALKVLQLLAAQPEHSGALLDVHSAPVATAVDGLFAPSGENSVSGFGLANDLGSDMDYQGVSDRYTQDGKLKDAQSVVDTLQAMRSRQDSAVQKREGSAAAFKPEDFLVKEDMGGNTMDSYQARRQQQDAQAMMRAQAFTQQHGGMPPPQMS